MLVVLGDHRLEILTRQMQRNEIVLQLVTLLSGVDSALHFELRRNQRFVGVFEGLQYINFWYN